MGAKTWMLIHSDGDLRDALRSGSALDPNATLALVSKLFPKQQFKYVGQGDLSYTNPPRTEVHAGCFPGFSVIAAMDYAVDYPSRLPTNLLEHARQGVAYLHAMHSVVDWFAFAIWKEGKLHRSLSLSPDSGVMEDIGDTCLSRSPFGRASIRRSILVTTQRIIHFHFIHWIWETLPCEHCLDIN